jgi:hypothetical protein
MTTCTPLKPFRCWQYRKGEPVPKWVGTATPRGCWVNELDKHWLVEAEAYSLGRWYTPAEFAERFKIVESDAVRDCCLTHRDEDHIPECAYSYGRT